MDRLISLQAAIDAPFKKYDMNTGVTWIPLEYVEQLPSAQPEIIRCCKCVHWQQDTIRQNKNDVSWWNEAVCDKYSDEIWTVWKDADWYCADAERRTDERAQF